MTNSDALADAEARLSTAVDQVEQTIKSIKTFDEASQTLTTLASHNQETAKSLKSVSESLKTAAEIFQEAGISQFRKELKTGLGSTNNTLTEFRDTVAKGDSAMEETLAGIQIRVDKLNLWLIGLAIAQTAILILLGNLLRSR